MFNKLMARLERMRSEHRSRTVRRQTGTSLDYEIGFWTLHDRVIGRMVLRIHGAGRGRKGLRREAGSR
jgi:hypothetical protein